MTEMTSPTTTKAAHDYYYDPDVREQIEDILFAAESMLRPSGGPIDGAMTGWLSRIGSAFPDDRGYLIPEEGCWIIVKRQPGPLSIPEPPLYSMWFAKPIYTSQTYKVVAGGRRRNVSWPFLKARITTPDGDLDLWPEEYVPVDDIMEWADMIGEGVVLNFIGPEPDEIAERTFYLRAHGLGMKDATALLLGDMQSNHVYLTLEIE